MAKGTHDGAQSAVNAQQALRLDNLLRAVDQASILRDRPSRVLDELSPAQERKERGAELVSAVKLNDVLWHARRWGGLRT